MLRELKSVDRTAHMRHQCSLFGCPIKPGDRYEITTLVYDERVYDWKSCLGCRWLAAELERRWPKEIQGYQEGSVALNESGILNFFDYICQVDRDPESGAKVRWIHPSTPCDGCGGRGFVARGRKEGRLERCRKCDSDGRRYWKRCPICLEYKENTVEPAHICSACHEFVALGQKIAEGNSPSERKELDGN